MRERPLSHVPKTVWLALSCGLLLQIGWHVAQPARAATIQQLAPPPSLTLLKLSSFGEPIALAKLLMLQLQAFDTQPGIAVPLLHLNYNNVQAWLSRILALDPPGQYPLLAASRLYGEVPDPSKQRQMLEFVYQRFLDDPNRRWPWLAHAAIIAKHRLHDLPLARQYAQAIRLHATGAEVPHWARQMEVFILEDMNEQDSAAILLGGLLDSGQITDPNELRFLTDRLKALQAAAQTR